jgi:hypothetical protein
MATAWRVLRQWPHFLVVVLAEQQQWPAYAIAQE